MNSFDQFLLTWINQFSRHSLAADSAIAFLSGHQFLKGGVLMTIVWWAWFTTSERQARNQEHLVVTLFCCFVAMFVARVLAFTLPFRSRPIHEEGLGFLVPYGLTPTTLDGWSSFPSDHAVLYFTLACGLLFISKKMGAFAIAYTAVFIALPRIYLGLHYPTDILAGGVIGAAISLLGNVYLTESKIVSATVTFSSSTPAVFYPLFFLLTYQIAELFNGVRPLLSPLKHLLARIS